MKVNILNLLPDEIEPYMVSLGKKSFHSNQIFNWLHRKNVFSFAEMTDLAKDLRKQLEDLFVINLPQLFQTQKSKDGAVKFGFKLSDGALIETVYIPQEERNTLCISSQVGCSLNCKFCFTAKMGFIRDLEPYEIISQVYLAQKELKVKISNIVLMGMGEPLLNYDNVLKAIEILISPAGSNFSKRKITLSTCGIVPAIEKFGKDCNVNIAVSLNASNDKTRALLMPINKKYPLAELMKVLKRYPLAKRLRITFEYIMMDGVNDSIDNAKELLRLLSDIPFKLNLIELNGTPYNKEGIVLKSSPMPQIEKFRDYLISKHVNVIIRKSRGRDIQAACGQLAKTSI